MLNKISPIEEKLVGTNGINYKHIYYLAFNTTNKIPKIDIDNKFQTDEIGDIGWFTYDETVKLIRPHHTNRKMILTGVYMFIINFIAGNI